MVFHMPNLIPHRHDPDMFVSRLAAVPLKEMSEHLEFPFFQIDPRPYRGIRRFGDSHGNSIELVPSVYGLPTIQDQDIFIYFLSKAMAEVRAGNPVPESIRMSTSELLRFTNRPTDGNQYASVENAIYRMATLTLKTNLRGAETEYISLFGIVDRANMVRRRNSDTAPEAPCWAARSSCPAGSARRWKPAAC